MWSIRFSAALLLLSVPTAMAQDHRRDSAPKAAQEPTRADAARALFDEGRDKHRLGQFNEAIELFKRSYELVPAPLLLFNLGQSYRLAGDCIDAVSYYQQFTRLAGDSPTRAEAERWLKDISPCSALGSGIVLPKRSPAVPIAAGASTLALVAPATSSNLNAAPPRPTSSRLRAVGTALIAAGLVAAALGVYFAFDATRAGDRTATLGGAGGTWDQNARANESSGLRAELASRISFAVTVPLLGAGVWAWREAP